MAFKVEEVPPVAEAEDSLEEVESPAVEVDFPPMEEVESPAVKVDFPPMEEVHSPPVEGLHLDKVMGRRFRGACREGEILHVDGSCVVPIVTRNVFVYDAPEQPQGESGPPPSIPPPRVDHNILFVRIPEEGPGPEPIIVPPPKQENIVYVLNKSGGDGGQRVIVTVAPPSNPEVYFVNYEEGENPTLPIGVDLQTALQAAAEAGGQVIGGSGGAGGGIGVALEDLEAGGAGGFEAVPVGEDLEAVPVALEDLEAVPEVLEDLEAVPVAPEDWRWICAAEVEVLVVMDWRWCFWR
nr:uncharacterized protein LOC113803053 [Penaeus vannamei]